MLELPYGIADFSRIIKTGRAYVDRTSHIRGVESLGENLLFIRPRRFGKSLWLQTLAAYYDLRTADEHEELFGRLAIGQDPTPNAHRYFVLQWDFSWVSPSGSVAEITAALNGYVNTALRNFLRYYRQHLPAITIRDNAKDTFLEILGAIRETAHPLYLLIDEYDNFANEVMVRDESVYSGLVHGVGPYKELMKAVKGATQGQGLERLFVTGISPVVMSDLSSGMNILVDVYQRPELNSLCGFKAEEIVDLLERIRAADEKAPAWTVEEARRTIRDWYNGYRFSPSSMEQVYNPTMTLYFLDHLQRYRESPRQLLDDNLAADEDKLRFIGQIVSGQQALLDVVQNDEPIEIDRLAGRFTLSEMMDLSANDVTFMASYLYYFGMLTLAGETRTQKLRLVPPNLVVKKLYAEQIRRFLLPEGRDRTAADAPVRALTQRGEIEGFLAFVEEKVFAAMSNRDYVWMNEHGLKMAFHVLLFNDISYMVFSEPEVGRGYADLCLLRRRDRPSPVLFDLLFELKYVKLAALGKTGEELRRMERKDLGELSLVKDCLADAEAQLRRYRDALTKRHGETLRLRAYSVVALGFERLVAREL
jgi:hypothetical protein